jgi:ferredoxin
MLRQLITIDGELCNGCWLCVSACHEGAIRLISGKARLIRDDYCDGLGNCLPVCPTGAISFETREAAPFDQAAVKVKLQGKEPAACPGARSVSIDRPSEAPGGFQSLGSKLGNFPVQLRLVAVNAPFLRDARLLLAADCAAYAHGDFHRRFMQGMVTLIGCPKLDDTDYADKLTEILLHNDLHSLTVARMEVPCCGGLTHAAREAVSRSGKQIPLQYVTLSTKGEIILQ